MSETSLAAKLVAVHRALESERIPHAFGGAIALAYYTLEPRGTRDVDVNIFVAQERCAAALDALPSGVERPPGVVEAVAAQGQTRLWWGDMPLDLFFDNVPIHAQAQAHLRRESFAGTEIPILGPAELVVFKAMFDRGRDWVDIESVIEAHTVDPAAVRRALVEMLGADDARVPRFDDIVDRYR